MMSSKTYRGIKVFAELTKEDISQISNMLDENIIRNPFDSRKIQELKNLGYTQGQSRSILEAFFNFYDALKRPEQMREFISKLDVNKDTKQLINETFEMILKKGDKSKVILVEKIENLKQFGHDHLHRLDAVVEFRPLVDDDKLQKIVLSIIIDGEIQNNAHSNPKIINFQTDFVTFQTVVNDLNKQLDAITTKIKILKEKFGDDAIDL